jgi:tetratricopeptide (TPR) repeat protein
MGIPAKRFGLLASALAVACSATAEPDEAYGFEARAVEAELATLDVAIAAAPTDANLLAERSRRLEHLGFLRAAEGELLKAVALHADDAAAWSALARVRHELRSFHESAVAAMRALALGDEAPATRLVLARSLRELGRPSAAAQSYAEALERSPAAEPGLLVEIARFAATDGAAALERRTLERVGALLDAADARHPRIARVAFARGLLAEARGDAVAALSAYRAAVERDPRCIEAWSNIALVAARAGDLAMSRQASEQAIALEEDPARREAWRRWMEEDAISAAER